MKNVALALTLLATLSKRAEAQSAGADPSTCRLGRPRPGSPSWSRLDLSHVAVEVGPLIVFSIAGRASLGESTERVLGSWAVLSALEVGGWSVD